MENAAFRNLALSQRLEDEEWSHCISSQHSHCTFGVVSLHLRKRHQTLQGHREKCQNTGCAAPAILLEPKNMENKFHMEKGLQ